VQINTEAPGYSPLEAEQRVTFPIETAMAGLPGLDYTRSLSRYGLSQVTVVFEDGTDIYFARQLVNERLQQVKSQLPPGLEPEWAPIATGLGEIFMYTVEAEEGAQARRHAWTPTDLRTLQDWVIRPQLRNCPASPRSTPSAASCAVSRHARPTSAGRAGPHAARCVEALAATTPMSAPATSSATASNS
jgi:cobalt-zinc-cadmium resistance protein CzcA